MQKKNVLIALITLSAVGLGACSKNNKHNLKARAEYAKQTNDKGEAKSVYEDAQKSIDKDRNDLSTLGVPMGGTLKDGVKAMTIGENTEKTEEAKRKLHNVINKAESQITAAQTMGNDELRQKAEKTKAEARNYINQINEQEAKDQAKAQKQEQKSQESKSEEQKQQEQKDQPGVLGRIFGSKK